MAPPITDLTIQDITSRGPIAVPGWTFVATDLNASVGGDFLYLGYRSRNSEPSVTSLDFKAFDKAQTKNPMPEWNWLPTDLNRGAKGKYIYMFWKVGEDGRPPITSVTVLQTTMKSPPDIGGWHATGCDLNKGAGGEYIWAYYSTLFP